MNRLIKKFKSVRLEFLAEVQTFPVNERTEKLFDKWSLQDVLVHITAWDMWTVEVIEDFRSGIVPYWPPSIDGFNLAAVADSKGKSWDDIYLELVESGALLIEMCKNIPKDLWNKKIWLNKSFTVTNLLNTEIEHYVKEHLSKTLNTMKEN